MQVFGIGTIVLSACCLWLPPLPFLRLLAILFGAVMLGYGAYAFAQAGVAHLSLSQAALTPAQRRAAGSPIAFWLLLAVIGGCLGALALIGGYLALR